MFKNQNSKINSLEIMMKSKKLIPLGSKDFDYEELVIRVNKSDISNSFKFFGVSLLTLNRFVDKYGLKKYKRKAILINILVFLLCFLVL